MNVIGVRFRGVFLVAASVSVCFGAAAQETGEPAASLPEITVTSEPPASPASSSAGKTNTEAPPPPKPGAVNAKEGSAASSGDAASGAAAGASLETTAESLPPRDGTAVPASPSADEVASIDVVTREDIRRAGAKSLDEALTLAPGLHMYAGTDGLPSTSIRGQRTRHVTVLLDGVPLSGSVEQRFDPASIPVEMIESIEVIRGASSVLYGPGGTAGVIDIVTRRAARGLHGTGEAEHGGPRQTRAAAALSAGGERTSANFAATALKRDYFRLSEDFEPTALQPGHRRINSDREDYAISTTVRHEASESARFSASLSFRRGEYGRLPATLTQDESIFIRRPRFHRIDDYEGLNLHVSSELEPGGNLLVRHTLFLNGIDELTNSFDDETYSTQRGARAFREDAESRIFGTGVLARTGDERANLSLALEARRETWRADGFENERGSGGRTASVPFDEEFGLDQQSAALEGALETAPGLRLLVGGGFARQDGGESEEQDHTYLAGVVFEPRGGTRLRASVARKIRFPNLRELHDRDRGNPDLTAEVNRQAEAGAEYTFDAYGLTIGCSVFHTIADNPIELFSGDQAHNAERYRFQGFEVEASWRISPEVRLRATYSHLDARDLSRDRDSPALSGRPQHLIGLASTWRMSERLTLDAGYRYIGGALDVSRTDPAVVRTLEEAHLIDVGLALQVAPGSELYGRTHNLLDEDYEHNTGAPQPGRSVFVGVRASF